MAEGSSPSWRPLLDLVGEQVVGDFMWMFEVELLDGRVLHAYKHIDTRRYIHLSEQGRAFVFSSPHHYRAVRAADVLAAVFVPLPGLFGLSDQQVEASRRAVVRLRDRSAGPSPESSHGEAPDNLWSL
jgi:hypothetical protein